jgi:hypothetical protein
MTAMAQMIMLFSMYEPGKEIEKKKREHRILDEKMSIFQ